MYWHVSVSGYISGLVLGCTLLSLPFYVIVSRLSNNQTSVFYRYPDGSLSQREKVGEGVHPPPREGLGFARTMRVCPPT